MKMNLASWRPGDGETGVVLSMEFEPDKGSCGRLASVLHKLPIFEQEALHLDGSRLRCDLCQLYTLVYQSDVMEYDIIKALKYALQRKYPEIFGKEESHPTELDNEYADDFCILESMSEFSEMTPGKHKYAKRRLIALDTTDYTSSDWRAICRLCGTSPLHTRRLVIDVNTIEAYIY